MARMIYCLNLVALAGFALSGLFQFEEREQVSWENYVLDVQTCNGTPEEASACSQAKWDAYLEETGFSRLSSH